MTSGSCDLSNSNAVCPPGTFFVCGEEADCGGGGIPPARLWDDCRNQGNQEAFSFRGGGEIHTGGIDPNPLRSCSPRDRGCDCAYGTSAAGCDGGRGNAYRNAKGREFSSGRDYRGARPAGPSRGGGSDEYLAGERRGRSPDTAGRGTERRVGPMSFRHGYGRDDGRIGCWENERVGNVARTYHPRRPREFEAGISGAYGTRTSGRGNMGSEVSDAVSDPAEGGSETPA